MSNINTEINNKQKDRLLRQIEFIIEVDKMKSIFRRSLLSDKTRRENDAEHSWHISLMAVLLYEYADKEVNLLRAVKMTIIHDLIEIYAGDTPAYDTKGNESKKEREQAAADKLFAILPDDQAEEIRALWEEFDAAETKDALFAASVDRLQPFLSNYVTEGYAWRDCDFDVTSSMVLNRLDTIRHGIPAIWGHVEGMVQECIDKGYLNK